MEEVWRDYKNIKISNKGRIHTKNGISFGYINKKGYCVVNLEGNVTKIHRLVYFLFGEKEFNIYKKDYYNNIHHVDENKSNNNITNLDFISNRENCSLSKRSKYSNYTGVSFDISRNKWTSSICLNNKLYNLGRHKCEFKALISYKKALNNFINLNQLPR